MSGEVESAARRVHRGLAAAALLLGLLAAFAGEPAAPGRADGTLESAARAAPDSAAADTAPRRRLDGRRGCAW